MSFRKSLSGSEAWNRARYGVFWPKIDFASTSLYTKRVSFGVWGGKMSRGVWGIHLVTLRPVQRLNFIVKIEKMTEFGHSVFCTPVQYGSLALRVRVAVQYTLPPCTFAVRVT